jgi:tRNA-Thr(GGU) m(6)t(6)A37 methyltransferase TsaA
MHNFQVSPVGKAEVNDKGMFIVLDEKFIPALQALDGFSHLNVIWWFSDFDSEEMRNILEAPQPYKKSPPVMGIFATRSPIRPNPIALSTAQIIRIDHEKGIVQVAYIDANDGTPVLDIKPYTPSLDRVETPGVPEWCRHWPKSLEQSESFDWESEFNF